MSAVEFAAAAPARIALPAPAVRARGYASPYLAGVGIGLVLLAAYVTVGRGLGASGAFSAVAAAGAAAVAPEQAAASPVLGEYLGGARGPLADWLVIELIGVAIGGYLSARLAGRRQRTVERGPRVTDRTRSIYGFGGGVVMGIGAKLARGCTSGQALTGGALLSVGSWIFIATALAAAFAAAPLFRREWT